MKLDKVMSVDFQNLLLNILGNSLLVHLMKESRRLAEWFQVCVVEPT